VRAAERKQEYEALCEELRQLVIPTGGMRDTTTDLADFESTGEACLIYVGAILRRAISMIYTGHQYERPADSLRGALFSSTKADEAVIR
jgi:hypothetical protein